MYIHTVLHVFMCIIMHLKLYISCIDVLCALFQSISFLLYVCAHEKKRPHLILSPLSVINNWKDELER